MRDRTRIPKIFLLFFSCMLLTQAFVQAQQLDTARIRQLNVAARTAFHSGQFEKNVRLTDSLAQTYADGGDFTGYAIFSMFNGWTYLNELKDYDRAAFFAHRSFDTVQEKLDGKLPYLDDLYGLLAGIYAGIGNPEKALEYNQLALQTVAELGKSDSFGDYVANSNLGTTYMDLQRWSDALPFLERARVILLQVGEKNGRDQRFNFNASQLQAHITHCYLGLNEPEKALKEAMAGLPYTKTDIPADHFGYHDIYLALAEAHSQNGRMEEAQVYFQLLEKIYGDNFGPNSTQMAVLFQHRAAHAIRQDELIDALDLNSQAMERIGIQTAGDRFRLVRQSEQIRCLTCEPGLFDQRVKLLWQMGQRDDDPKQYLEACLASADLALESLQELRKTLLFREGSKQVLFEQFQNMLKRGSLAAQRLYELSGEQRYLAEAFRLAEQSKANVLLEALVMTRAEAYAGLPPAVLEQERSLSLALVRQEKLLEEARSEHDTLRAKEIQNGPLFEGKQRYEAFLTQLKEEYPTYFAARHQVSVPSLQNLQQALAPDDLMVFYLLNKEDGRLQTFVISNEEVTVESLPWEATYEQLIENYYTALQQVSLIQTPKRLSFIRQSNQLYKLLIQPFATQMAGKTRLIIVADDVLHHLPFETLISKETDAAFTELDFLIRDIAVSYQYSGAVFLEGMQKKVSETGHLLAFAPVFEEVTATAQFTSSDRSALESAVSGFRQGRFTPLPWSEREVVAIGELFVEGGHTILLHQAANEQALKEAMERGGRYLHLATHSFANRKNPRFSGIACAQVKGMEGEEDGILYTSEIYRQTIKFDLVVLSSCESGVGQLASGEGMLGLNRSFIYAGVPNVLYSLWRVDDRRSSELMVGFYQSLLAGQAYHEALRQAKLSMLEKPETAFPVHWSAFTLISR